MKKLFLILCLIILYGSVFGQIGNDTTRYLWYRYQYGQRMPRMAADSVLNLPKDTLYSKYGLARISNRLYLGNGLFWTLIGGLGGGTFIGIDSVTYNNNSICQWKNNIPTCYPVIPGVDSVTVVVDTLCEWRAGIPTCYTIDGNVLGTFLDSVTVFGNQLCQWLGGISTCYTINNTSSGIDSLTVADSLLCSWSQGISTCFIIWHPDTIYVTDDLYVVWDSTGHQVIGRYHSDGLISGGIVTKSDCWKVDVTPPTYYFNRIKYTLAQSLGLDIDSADVLPRVDYVVADSFGLIYVIPGTPSITPIGPEYDPGYQVVLGIIQVPGGATCLGITSGMIYDEHIAPPEYLPTTSGTITVDFDNTDRPYHLTKAAFISQYNFGNLVFTKDSGTDTIVGGSVLKLFIWLNIPYTSTLSAQFRLGTTPVSSRQVIAASEGFNTLLTGFYQNVSILTSRFTFSSPIYDNIVFYNSGTDTSGAGGLYIDQIEIQKGIVQTQKTYVDSVTRIGDSLYYHKNGLITFISAVSSGGGGGGNNIYNIDSSLSSNRTVDLNGNYLQFQEGGNNLLYIDPTAGAESTLLQALNQTGSTNNSLFSANTTNTDATFTFGASFDGGTKLSTIVGFADATTSTITNTADTILFNSTLSGASNGDVWTLADPTTGSGYWGVGGGGSDSLDIPLAGTHPGKPVTGPILITGATDVTPVDIFNIYDEYGELRTRFISDPLYVEFRIRTEKSTDATQLNMSPGDWKFNTKNGSDSVYVAMDLGGMYGSRYWEPPYDESFVQKHYVDSAIAAGGGGTVTSVTGTAPILSSGGTTPDISLGTVPIANGGTNNASLSVTAGTVYYGDGTKLVGLAPGTSSQILHSGTTPSWKDTASTVITRQVITSGGAATVTGSNYILNIDPAATLPVFQITLPASPTDMQTVQVDFGGTLTSGIIVTALTILPNSGQTILDNTPPGSGMVDNTLFYRYRLSNTTWYRLKF